MKLLSINLSPLLSSSIWSDQSTHEISVCVFEKQQKYISILSNFIKNSEKLLIIIN